tara:strand:- start:671 stop:1105 length:435 start_codon:yes stop_codon:yes gene_type:complete
MKKNIILTILILFVINLSFAQIDRTKQPESGPDPEIKFGTPKTFKLKNGIQVLVVEDDKLPVVTYSLRIDRNPIIDGEKVGVSTLLSAMLGNGTTNIPKDEFNEEVEFLGASVSVAFSGGSANTLTKNNARVLELWSDAILTHY